MQKRHVFIPLVLLAPTLLFAQEQATAPSDEPAAPSAELQQKHQEYMEIREQIASVEEQARTTPPVQEKMVEFRDAVTEEMVRQEPEMRADVERQTELVEELTTKAAEEGADDADRQKKLAEYQQLRSKLMPVERRAQEAEDVVEAREAYRSVLIAEMEKIDPDISSKLERHNELASELQQRPASAPKQE